MPQPLVRVQMDYRATHRALKNVQKEQFPWAYTQALNKVAKLAQHAVRTQTRLEFDLHTEYIPRGVLVEFARKSDLKNFKSAYSAVFTSRKITPFMAWHETGGIRRPRGRSMTLPGPNIHKYKFKTSTGKVRKPWKPVQLLNKGRAIAKGTHKKGRLTRAPFIIPRKGSKPAMVVRRVTRGARGLEVLYTFQPMAIIKPTWGFAETVDRIAKRFFPQVMRKEFAKALKTAR